MEPSIRSKYSFTEYRKSNLLRLKKYMNELLIDQIPILTPMLRSLEELSIINVQATDKMSPFVVQQMPEMRNSIIYGKNWKEIAHYQIENYLLKQDQQQLKEDMEKMSNLYGQEWIEGITEGFICPVCQKEASKRCSKCKNVWYCSRECQVKDWPTHKSKCITQAQQINPTENAEKVVVEVQQQEVKKPAIEELD